MKIPIDNIFTDPSLPKRIHPARRHRGGDRQRSKRTPVVLAIGNEYMLLVGGAAFQAAINAGDDSIECTVKTQITPREHHELSLAEKYCSSLVPAMDLARLFISYRAEFGITQRELGRRTGITAGIIHHYESLVRDLDPSLGEKVDSGELTFKEARSIADIDGHDRQREIAQPFIDGQLSSVDVERIVKQARIAPSQSIENIIQYLQNGFQTPPPAPTPTIRPPRPVEVNTDLIENAVLKIAGEIDALQMHAIPEYRRLKLVSSLRILDHRLKSAIINLNGDRSFNSQRVGVIS